MATRTTIHQVIENFQGKGSTSERGTRFEQLMVDWFRLDPTLASEYDEVQMWPDWSHNEHTHDSGIDLVARNRGTGRWTAVQCKFYDPRYSLQKTDIDSFFTASGRAWDSITFDNRIIISTTDRWSNHAEKALENQTVPVQRIGLADIAESPIDWMRHDGVEVRFEPRKAKRYSLRPHQKEAIDRIQEGFRTHDRGKWVSACGTGKTFASLKLAEQRCAENGGRLKVLFLAPSISLVSQTLREWMAQSQTLIRPLVVCSDTKASKQAEDITVHDIPLPTTDAGRLAAQMGGIGRRGRQMVVVFSTYQSIDVVAQAQRASGEQFDLILCDEAHRTTGVTLPGAGDESAFVKVHNNSYLPADKRLYMTATPRIYGEEAKKKAADHSVLIASMDDETIFGPEFHRLGFGEAVERDLLADYKVMILCVAAEAVAEPLQGALANEEHEITLDDAAKIVGCWNGLAKRTTDMDFGPDPAPMRRAVAFAQNIKASKAFARAVPDVVDSLIADRNTPDLEVACHHVDGTMNALTRSEQLAWLKAPAPENECRVLSNARCLSEGVDVPALDAVLFLSPRNSLVDVVQSVGRVMRKPRGKDYGYIILPVAIDANESPEEAMRSNKRFKVVWDVLNALRAHDDRFNAMINSIDLDGSTKGRIGIGVFDAVGVDAAEDGEGAAATRTALASQAPLFALEMRSAILARIVKKVGERDYWDSWADDVVRIHTNQTTRIDAVLASARRDHSPLMSRFDEFLEGLRANINESIGEADAIDMLSQHLITRPVFEALFPAGSFAEHNPVSVSMQAMVDALAGQGLEAETAALTEFYDSVRARAASVTTPEGRQTIIHRLYEDFFKKAFPKQASSFGVVYTPVEIVDFILRAADEVCRSEFGYGISDEGVHVLDPFTGTGTFIVRLLQSDIIAPADLARKYAHELWANEIMLLAYYIACVNIETTYQAIRQRELGPDQQAPYVPFPGATLTDTFQITEDGDRADSSLIPVNNERIEAQLRTPIKVIVGNPPYSVGQSSANDDNANLRYPTLDGRIADTYAALSTATNKKNLYDSYIRAFRWASDRLGEQGVMAFVSNNGWVDDNAADGIRKSFTGEFSHIWVHNLRGNQRTAGETSRREGGKVFGSGARIGVAVLIAAKDPAVSGCRLHYWAVPDYQSREEKLTGIDDASLSSIPWQEITPNDAGDWINQRNVRFDTYPTLCDEAISYFASHSRGVETTRDAWCYNFSTNEVRVNMSRMIDFYNQQASSGFTSTNELDLDPKKVSWSRNIKRRALAGKLERFIGAHVRKSAIYRPFTKQALYFDPVFNSVPGKNFLYFPTPAHENYGIYIVGEGSAVPFSAVMLNTLPNLHVTGAGSGGQFFPRWTYEKIEDDGAMFSSPAEGVIVDGYRRVDNITDGILDAYRATFGPQVSKGDIFHYVYAVLHSPQYRSTFAADLKRMLPRIPSAASPSDFSAFAEAGRQLAHLHMNYESAEPYPLHESTHPLGVDDWELYRVRKMKWQDKKTKKAIVYNDHLTLSDIPAEANEYMLGSRSGLEWLIDRYQVRTDKDSGIVNDPNDWCREHDDPRYIIDLIKRVTRVSVETMRIVRLLPELPL
ncbi:type ISP restriction/modification enzyme [uncultured Propionibacterium sp.]|uniref:DEAD/DEAH box helicase n=1 Tax=uncultured Propionibacterium sp. TaxID=218066 RepID=UPI002930D9A8|nr:type ISP restriction/modification enzyme [uncultured Propionibacterium sp.]